MKLTTIVFLVSAVVAYFIWQAAIDESKRLAVLGKAKAAGF